VLALAGREAPPAVVAAAADPARDRVVDHLEAAHAADILHMDEQGAPWFRRAPGRRRASGSTTPTDVTSTCVWPTPGSTSATAGWLDDPPAPATSSRHAVPRPRPVDPHVDAGRAGRRADRGRIAPEAEQLLTIATTRSSGSSRPLVDRARLEIGLGEARWELGDRWLAAKTFEHADDLLSSAEGPVDLLLRARPSPPRAATPTRSGTRPAASELIELDRELPHGDHPCAS
jgi:hypothetical protein